MIEQIHITIFHKEIMYNSETSTVVHVQVSENQREVQW